MPSAYFCTRIMIPGTEWSLLVTRVTQMIGMIMIQMICMALGLVLISIPTAMKLTGSIVLIMMAIILLMIAVSVAIAGILR